MAKIFVRNTFNDSCENNNLNCSRIIEFFRQNGFSETDNDHEAEFIIVNTCGVDYYRENGSLKCLEQYLSGGYENKRIIVTGCLPDIRPEIRNDKRFTSIGPREQYKLNSLIEARIPFEKIEVNRPTIGSGGYDNAYYIKISRGCLGSCSYCAIKTAKGDLVSEDEKGILRSFDSGLKEGWKRFVLMGDELGCYGQDSGTNIIGLLSKIVKRKGDYEILLHYIEPRWLMKYSDSFLDVFKTGRISFVNVPLQSGSDRILRLMDRHYRVGDVLRVVRGLKHVSPNTFLHTHIIFGFPTETARDFRASVKATRAFDSSVFFLYSERPGTRASKIKPAVPENDKRSRLREVIALTQESPRRYSLGYEYAKRFLPKNSKHPS